MFSNDSISLNELPKVEDLILKRLPTRYKYTQIIRRTGTVLIAIAIALFLQSRNADLAYALSRAKWASGPIMLAWIVLPLLEHRVRGYAVRQLDLVYRSGLIWRKTTAIAFGRVQHIEVKQDVLSRWFSLASLELYTAGGRAGDLCIPGLDRDDADKLRDYILAAGGNG
ncbi:MAG: PH domain-containing protein [Pseudomonadota bacterium]